MCAVPTRSLLLVELTTSHNLTDAPLPLTPSIAKPNLWGGLRGDSKLALLFISRRSQRPRFVAAVAGRRHLREDSDSAACVAQGQAKLFGLKGCLAALLTWPTLLCAVLYSRFVCA